MGNNTMKFAYDGTQMNLVCSKADEIMQEMLPTINNCFVVDIPRIKKKTSDYFSNVRFAALPVAMVGKGVFWPAFLSYIFPWIIDVSKVYCAIKITQGFYKEKKMGMGGGGDSGISSMLTYGKWFIFLMLIPWAVELTDGLATKMYRGLIQTPIS